MGRSKAFLTYMLLEQQYILIYYLINTLQNLGLILHIWFWSVTLAGGATNCWTVKQVFYIAKGKYISIKGLQISQRALSVLNGRIIIISFHKKYWIGELIEFWSKKREKMLRNMKISREVQRYWIGWVWITVMDLVVVLIFYLKLR